MTTYEIAVILVFGYPIALGIILGLIKLAEYF